MRINSIKVLLYETVHKNQKSVEQIADETGISSSYLYRSVLPSDKSGARFPLDYLIPVMKAADNYSVLKHLASLCGYALLGLPRDLNNTANKSRVLNDFQQATITAASRLLAFFSDTSKENHEAVNAALQEVIEKSAMLKLQCEKEFSGQLEINL